MAETLPTMMVHFMDIGNIFISSLFYSSRLFYLLIAKFVVRKWRKFVVSKKNSRIKMVVLWKEICIEVINSAKTQKNK